MASKQEVLEEIQIQRRRLHSLRSLPLWEELANFVEEQVAIRTHEIVLTPLENHDKVLEQEFAKGEVNGIWLFVQYVASKLDELNAMEEMFEKEIADEHEDAGEE